MRSRISARPVVPKPAVFCDRSCLVAKGLVIFMGCLGERREAVKVRGRALRQFI